MKKKRIVIIVIGVCLLALVAGILGYKSLRQNHINQLLELGDQYLSDAQYEEAIASYKQVLAIEPKEETACENIVVAAVDWTDDLIEEKDFDKAKEVLADVQTVVVDSRLEEKLTEVETAQDAYEEEQEAEVQIMDTLNELAEICATADADAIFSYKDSEAYAEICSSEYFNFDTKYETENGSLGLYENGECLYYGDYDGEQRSGQGAWYGSGSYYAVGAWADDKPNGAQKVSKSWKEDGRNDTYFQEGTVVDGVWNGDVILTETYRSENVTYAWSISFDMGKYVVLGTGAPEEDHPYLIGRSLDENAGGMVASQEELDIVWGIEGFSDRY
jgi:tetratricopeptide (TPR) repeat protein